MTITSPNIASVPQGMGQHCPGVRITALDQRHPKNAHEERNHQLQPLNFLGLVTMVPTIYQGWGVSVGVKTGCLNLSLLWTSEICEAKEPQILQPNGCLLKVSPSSQRSLPLPPGAVTQPITKDRMANPS